MLAKVFTAAQLGMDGRLVEIECDMSNSLPGIVVVGLGNKAVDEARDRVRSAIKNSGLLIPPKRITYNLAPADLPKDGTAYDLGMAIALLISSEQLPPIPDALFMGELGLDGAVRSTAGTIAGTKLAKHHGFKHIFIPYANIQEAARIQGVKIFGVRTLKQLFEHLSGQTRLRPYRQPSKSQTLTIERLHAVDFADIYGQQQAKRAMLIAASGGHNIFLNGPPGAGKTMLSQAMSGILPPLSSDEEVELIQLYELAGYPPPANQARPFRTPHHSASNIALIGGGTHPRPGEISLSHHGVLFLDELPEFRREALEALRQPLEEGKVTIARAAGVISFPSRFILIAAQNPCPCGYYGDDQTRCRCTTLTVKRYQTKVSGPLLDRFDIHVRVRRLKLDEYRSDTSIRSIDMRSQVDQARLRQYQRLGDGRTNAHMTNSEIERYCLIDDQAAQLARQAVTKLTLSTRAYMRICKVARTIADLDNATNINSAHMSEALHYRATA